MSDPRPELFEPMTTDKVTIFQATSYFGPGVCNAGIYSTGQWLNALYVVAAMLFIMSLKGLSQQPTAKWGCIYGTLGMSLAILGAYFSAYVCDDGVWLTWVCVVPGAIAGCLMAYKVTMIQMPMLVGLLNAFGGLASVFEALGMFTDAANQQLATDSQGNHANFLQDVAGTTGAHNYFFSASNGTFRHKLVIQSIALHAAAIIGSITFFGSLVAVAKLGGHMDAKPRTPPPGVMSFLMIGAGVCCALGDATLVGMGYDTVGGNILVLVAVALAGAWGYVFAAAIGGADMPVVICILNTGSGVAGVFAGFMLANTLLVITGTFVAASGCILSVLMCVAMNRNLFAVLAGGFGDSGGAAKETKKTEGEIRPIESPEVAKMFNSSKSIIIVPGYGMAAGKAQHGVAKAVEILRKRKINVRFAIHPVAGRMPGHMNVLLAEAKVPYDIVLSMDKINAEFEKTDCVLVLGANDIVNPCAETDPDCSIAGMPVLQVWKAKNTFVVKRGKGAGYAGVDNPLFVNKNNRMFYGNAAEKMDQLVAELEKLGGAEGDDVAIGMDDVEVEETEETLKVLEAPEIKLGLLADDIEDYEKRVALAPTVCKEFNKKGYQVYVDKNAGRRCRYRSDEYEAAGAIVTDRSEVIANADILFSVMPTAELRAADPKLAKKLYVTWVGKNLPENKSLLEAAAAAGIDVLDVVSVPRLSIAQKCDVLSSQAKCAGTRAVYEAFQQYGKFVNGEITAAGDFAPCKVMVLGCGVAGLAAIGIASSNGAEVRAWDVRDVSDQVESLGGSWMSVNFVESGEGVGGYAKESSDAFKAAQKKMFAKNAREVDIIITTAAIPGRASPVLIETEMVQAMKPGSVIVDLAAMGGGNCTATKKGMTYDFEDRVTIIGDLDFPSKMARQCSEMFGNNMFNLLEHIATAKKGNTAKDILPTIAEVCAPKEGEEGAFTEVITDQSICVYGGSVRVVKPPPPPTAVVKKETTGEGEKKMEKTSAMGDSFVFTSQFQLSMFTLMMAGFAILDNEVLIQLMMVFVLAAWVGMMLVYGVDDSLHTPLMSISNAISGQVILGGIFMVSSANAPTAVLGGIAIFIASMNVFGGFAVTVRMLSMMK